MKLIPWWAKALAVLAMIGIVIGSWQWREAVVDQQGYDRAVTERKQKDDAELAAATSKAREAEQALRAKIDADSAARLKETKKYEDTIADLRADVRRGAVRLRAPGACVPANPAPADPAAAGRPGAEAGFVLLPETAQSVLDAGADLRQGVLDYNALVDVYNTARATCNAN